MGNAERAHKKFPECGRGLGHLTPTIFGIRSNISPKLLELQASNLVCMGNAEQVILTWPSVTFSSMGKATLGKRCFRRVHRCRPAAFGGRLKVNRRNIVRGN